MGFMQPEILDKARVFCVGTSEGSFYVPDDCFTPHPILSVGVTVTEEDGAIFKLLRDGVRDYVSGSIESIEVSVGYLGRYQAPGYMDCTDWHFGTNKRQLERELREAYGE